MASPDSGGGGGGGLGVAGVVLGGMHLGGLGRRLLGGSTNPQASRAVRRELLTIPGVDKLAPGKYRLPAIPGVSPYTTTNVRRDLNRFVTNWRAYSAGISASGPVGPQIPVPTTPDAAPGHVNRPSTGYPTGYPYPPSSAPPRGPTPKPNPNAPPPGMPGKYGTLWAVLIQVAIQYGWPILQKKISESWDAYFQRWMDREAKLKGLPKRRTPGGPGQRPSRPVTVSPNRPGTPGGPPVTAAPGAPPTIVIYNPPAPAPRPAPPAAPKPTDGLSVPEIYRRPLPVPVPAPIPTPLWQQIALAVAPSALTPLSKLLGVGSGKRSKLRDPLTVPQGPAVSFVTTNYPTQGGGAFFGATPSSKTCRCGPKKKRGPRKKRTVCYKGSYTERASGITKRKRERVPCQA